MVGKRLNYSFSKDYFTKKFQQLHLKNHFYTNVELENISDLEHFCKNNAFDFSGFNITIPYKEEIIPFLDEIEENAKNIGAVNIVLINNNKLIGYNTDYLGFSNSILPYLKSHHKKALILGTGGASKAVAYALKLLNIQYKFVSRYPEKGYLYSDLNQTIIEQFQIIINTTPIGTYPDILDAPNIPYEFLNKDHLVYDLVYNPSLTQLLIKAKKQGATIINGEKMLEIQAEKAWEIWNS